ncbi:MAG TPA: hypothetical protein PKE55_11900 [Kiritimatiellia bacterium]|nr:hypothetical protein [Kiritimatiellia bacterium]
MPFPEDYPSWRQCLVQHAEIEPTTAYFRERLQVFSQSDHPETKRFRQIYGDDRWQILCQWLERAVRDTAQNPGPP